MSKDRLISHLFNLWIQLVCKHVNQAYRLQSSRSPPSSSLNSPLPPSSSVKLTHQAQARSPFFKNPKPLPSRTDVRPTKEVNLAKLRSELEKVKEKGQVLALKSTDVKQVCMRRLMFALDDGGQESRFLLDSGGDSKNKTKNEENNNSDFKEKILKRKSCEKVKSRTKNHVWSSLLFTFVTLLVLTTAIYIQKGARLSQSRCLVYNNYLVMEISRPLADCDFCQNVTGAIVLQSPSKEDFAPFAYSGKPILVKGGTSNWTALSTFSLQFFKRLYTEIDDGYTSIDEECQFFPFRTKFVSLRQVLTSVSEVEELPPWYIGWSNCNPDIAKRLRVHYQRPAFLPTESESSAIDWIFMGSPGQGSSMHLDYVQRPSWQAQISGSKTWTIRPLPECETVCQSFKVKVEEGDIVLINTNLWYHDTFINQGKLSITIGSEYD